MRTICIVYIVGISYIARTGNPKYTVNINILYRFMYTSIKNRWIILYDIGTPYSKLVTI